MLKIGRQVYKRPKFGKPFPHLISTVSHNITPFLSLYYLL